jgi:hypothetical protein
MTPLAAAKSLTEESLADVRRRPQFRTACEMAARGAIRHFAGLPPHHQWVTKDLGRGSITLTALILHLMDNLTVRTLTANCVAQGVSSPGRVAQLVRRSQDAGEFTVDAGPGVWTRRRARLGPGFVEAARSRLAIDIEPALLLAPELADARELLREEDEYLSFVVALGVIVSTRRDLFALSSQPPLNLFLNREAGIFVLYELMIVQPADRERLLEEAPISRNALAHRYGISRAHINKMLADSGHTSATRDRVIFTPELSASLERHLSLVFKLTHVVAASLLDGWRVGAVASRPALAAGGRN